METTFSLSSVTGEKGGKGTVDVVIDCGDVWHIVDFKYGAGVSVDVVKNHQLILYGLGVLNAWSGFLGEPQNIVLTIVQPRSRRQDPIKTWDTTPAELREWESFFFKAACEALKNLKARSIPHISYSPSEKACRFCRAKARCPALAREVMLATKQSTQPLNNHELSKALDTLPLVEAYVKAIKDEAYRALNEGEELPHYELKEGRKGNRTYKDARQAEQVLRRLFGDQALRSVLISPAEADKLAKANSFEAEEMEELQKRIIRPNGKPQVTRTQEETQQQARLDEFKAVA